jgi:hypothetical protein
MTSESTGRPDGGFRAAGDASALLAASDGHPAVLIVLDPENDTIRVRCAGVDPATVPVFLQRLGRLVGGGA